MRRRAATRGRPYERCRGAPLWAPLFLSPRVSLCTLAYVTAGLLFVLAATSQALAHATEKAFVLLLPTGYYIVGGTLAVAASFLLLLIVPGNIVAWAATARVDLGAMPSVPPVALSGISAASLIILLLAGWFGSRDPLANPLPLAVWTLWWVGLTIAQAFVGDLWAAINPWVAPYRLLRFLIRKAGASDRPPLTYPAWLGYWPATIGFLAFTWFELVDPAPNDPARLALAVAVYAIVTLAGMLLFGERAWLSRGECFSVFFGFVGSLAPLQVEPVASPQVERHRLVLRFPGAALARRTALPLSGVAFVLLTLATVSFDGLGRTFWWLDLGGINPLEFPGRTAVMARNSLGLLGLWAALAAAYSLAIALGCRLAGLRFAARQHLRIFVLSILPISLGYHFAHYLTAFMVNAQYALLAFGDPFARGWDLLGVGGRHVTMSFLSNYDAVSVIWKMQATAVVAGHVLAVALAHVIAVERLGSARAALLSQLPLALLMIGYTLFGLWLLAAPTAG